MVMTTETVIRPIASSMLLLIGDTPTIPYPGRPGIYLKLESFNPTWTIADRLIVNVTVGGASIHFAGAPEICAAAALLGCTLQLPVTFDPSRLSASLLMAESLGATQAAGHETTLMVDPFAALRMLVTEIRSEVPDVSMVLLPADSPLACEADLIEDVRIAWCESVDDGGAELRRLSRAGVFIDPPSAAAFGAICAATSRGGVDGASFAVTGPVVAVATGGGALACADYGQGDD